MLREGDTNNYGALPPENINEPHMPVLFLVDNSSSMYAAIEQVNAELNRLAREICSDAKVKRMIDTCIMTFNDSTALEQDWRPVTEMNEVNLTAHGGTELGPALEAAVDKLRERGHVYDKGIEVRMPYLILITDGYGGDVTKAAEIIHKRTAEKKMQLWVLCVKGYHKETIAKLTDGIRAFELLDENSLDFSGFFNFIGASVKAVSTSNPGERIHVENPLKDRKNNLKIADLDDWINP